MKSVICLFLCVAILYVIQASESDFSCLAQCRSSSSVSDCLKTCAFSYKDEDQSDADWFRGGCSNKCSLAFTEESDIHTCRARCFAADFENDFESDTSSPLSGKAIWEAYAKQLFAFFKQGTDAKGLQLLRTPVPATWNTEARQLSDFCNRMSHWGVEHDWNGKLFSEEYIGFLKNIKQSGSSKPATPNPELEAALALVEELKLQLEEDKKKCQIRYDRFKKPGQTYDDFERRSCNSVELTSFDLKNAQYRVIELSGGAATNDVQEAIAKFEKQAGAWEFRETFINTLPAFLRKIQSKTADSFNIQVSQSSSTRSNSTQEWSWEQIAKNNKTTEFISVANGSSHTFTTSQDSFKMDLTAEGYTAIQVGPESSWFSSAIVKKYQAGPFKDTSKKYFGKNGDLSMVASTLYLLYKPTIKLYLSDADAQYLSKVKSSITVGPFTIQASGISVKATEGGVSQVTLTSGDETPVIVAVENAFLPQ